MRRPTLSRPALRRAHPDAPRGHRPGLRSRLRRTARADETEATTTGATTAGTGHVAFTDILRDVADDLLARPGRTLLTALGTLVGIAVLVAALGLATSLESSITRRFDAIAPREVTLTPKIPPGRPQADAADALPFDAPARLTRIDGVVAAANLSELTPERPVQGSPVHDPTRARVDTLRIIAASPGAFETLGAHLTGAPFTDFHDRRGETVAVLGREAARRLGITDTRGRPVVIADGLPLVVVGIIDSTERKSSVLGAIVVPDGLARTRFHLDGPTQVVALTRPGAADAVAAQAPLALRPGNPGIVQTSVPPTATTTRDAVSSDTRGLLLALAGVSLVIGGVGIANVTLVAVLQRTTEIGLRRAIGARRRDILTHFLATSTIIGALGALLGTCAGAWITVAVAAVQGWPPTLDRWVLLAGPVIGTLIGLHAGLYPSWRAATIEPIDALRAGA